MKKPLLSLDKRGFFNEVAPFGANEGMKPSDFYIPLVKRLVF